jgi:HEAT repeat protein
MATRVMTPAEALAAMARGERSGVEALIRQGAAAIPAVVAQYAKTRGAVGRAAALFVLMRFARVDAATFALGLSALKDAARPVRERAAALLVYSLRDDALPALERFEAKPLGGLGGGGPHLDGDPTLARAALVAIRARSIAPFAEVACRLFYFDRRDLGRAPWPSFADDFAASCGAVLEAIGFHLEPSFGESVAFVRGASRFTAHWDNYDVELRLALNGVDLQALLRAAKSPFGIDEARRQPGASRLGQLGALLTASLPLVLENEARLREEVAQLNAVLSGGADKVPALLTLLDPRSEHYGAAADSLGRLGQKAGKAAAVKLAAGLAHAAVEVRQSSASALESVATKGSVPELVGALADSDAQVRGAAVRTFSRLGKKAAAAAPALAAALARAQPPWLRIQLAGALIDVAGDTYGLSAEPVLVKALSARSPLDRAQAARVLARLPKPGPQALAALRRALADREPVVQIDAAAALVVLAPRTATLKSTLTSLANEPRRPRFQKQAEALLRELERGR